MKLVLFDIDGTLIDSGGAGTRALNLAFKQLFNIEDGFKGIKMAGKTDTRIIKDGLTRHALPVKNLKAVIDAYLQNLKIEINNNNKHLKPGVHELLNELTYIKKHSVGLLTGNLEIGARIKLEPFNLNKYFLTGAFGSDSEDRNMLLPIAVKRFENIFKIKFRFDECFVIGDTPLDIECAKLHGAYSIAVATGPYSLETLLSAGADYVVNNLKDEDFLRWFMDIIKS